MGRRFPPCAALLNGRLQGRLDGCLLRLHGCLRALGDCAVRSFNWMLGLTVCCALVAPAVLCAKDAQIPPAYLADGSDSPIAVYAAATCVDEQGASQDLGASVDNATLADLSGGTLIWQDTNLTGTMSNNNVDHVVTGDNVITGNSLSGATGFPTVIQNSGNSVLIQNATVLNVQFQP